MTAATQIAVRDGDQVREGTREMVAPRNVATPLAIGDRTGIAIGARGLVDLNAAAPKAGVAVTDGTRTGTVDRGLITAARAGDRKVGLIAKGVTPIEAADRGPTMAVRDAGRKVGLIATGVTPIEAADRGPTMAVRDAGRKAGLIMAAVTRSRTVDRGRIMAARVADLRAGDIAEAATRNRTADRGRIMAARVANLRAGGIAEVTTRSRTAGPGRIMAVRAADQGTTSVTTRDEAAAVTMVVPSRPTGTVRTSDHIPTMLAVPKGIAAAGAAARVRTNRGAATTLPTASGTDSRTTARTATDRPIRDDRSSAPAGTSARGTALRREDSRRIGSG